MREKGKVGAATLAPAEARLHSIFPLRNSQTQGSGHGTKQQAQRGAQISGVSPARWQSGRSRGRGGPEGLSGSERGTECCERGPSP